MLFSSIPFLYYFLPVVLLLYFIAPKKLKNGVLLLSSLFFYGWGEPRYLVLMAASILMGYFFGILIERCQKNGLAKVWVVLSCVSSLALIGYFKYADFFIENWNALTGLSIPLLKIALPIGISFYTFQILSYTIDVYRGDTKAQHNLVHFAAYVSLFPQLIAGPIVRYADVAAQLENRTHTLQKTYEGVRRFVVGLSKKILLANAFGALCDVFRESNEKTVLFYWMYGIAFCLQIYFDFSGYSDMAIGLGKLFGFDFLENFNYPYISKSITEFWRRWHMSLGSWFRDYVYIPLGGNRVPKVRWFFNILIVWLLTGLWHGAAWNFVLWGLLFAILLLLEKVWLSKALHQLPRLISHLYVLFLIMISFMLFNAVDLGQAVTDIQGLFGGGGISLWNQTTLYYLRSYAVVLLLGMVGATPVVAWAGKKMRGTVLEKGKVIIEPILICIGLLLVTAYLVDGSFNPFLYFRF